MLAVRPVATPAQRAEVEVRQAILLIGIGLAVAACASRLPRDLSDHAPHGAAIAEQVDLDSIEFRQLSDGESLRLGAYMRASGLEYLLLVFGSRGCAICQQKAQALQEQVIGRHPLFVTDAGKKLQIMGINTDPLVDARLRAYLTPLPFIQWNDPAGQSMLAHFMPPGRRFAVPLTVLVRAPARGSAGIVWRILPEEAKQVTIEAMMQRLQQAIQGSVESVSRLPGSDATPADPLAAGGGTAPGRPTDDEPTPQSSGAKAKSLADSLPGRLAWVAVKDCQGNPASLDVEPMQVQQTFIQLVTKTCDRSCLALAEHIEQRCRSGGIEGKSCRFFRLMSDPSATCRFDYERQGGKEFFEVFATHFNWAYRPIENPDYSLSLPAVQGPLLLGFDSSNGRLTLSHEGVWTPQAFDLAIAANRDLLPARGPDFRWYDPGRGEFGFADVRRMTRYTIVNTFSTVCSSCITELKEWSASGQIIDFCAARPNDCQVMAVERTDQQEPNEDLASYYRRMQQILVEEGIRVPMYLDAKPIDDYLGRFFDGYIAALKPEWGGLFGSLVYDQEGKIVQSFAPSDDESQAHDAVLRYMQRLLPQES